MERFRRQQIDVKRLPSQVLEKWSSAVLNEGFVPFPKKLVRCLCRLFIGDNAMEDLAAILAIVDFKRPNLSRMPSADYLSFLAGLDLDEFNAALRRLEQKGYIAVKLDGEGLEISIDGLLDAIQKQTAPVV
jgi:hypothetical protein